MIIQGTAYSIMTQAPKRRKPRSHDDVKKAHQNQTPNLASSDDHWNNLGVVGGHQSLEITHQH